jgi:hypothetical protein
VIALVLLGAVGAFLLAYRWYGRWLTTKLALDDRRAVPAELQYDGVDYVPARTPILLGHHFSSIAAPSSWAACTTSRRWSARSGTAPGPSPSWPAST